MYKHVHGIHSTRAMREQAHVVNIELLQERRHRLDPCFYPYLERHWRRASHPWPDSSLVNRNICATTVCVYLSTHMTLTPHSEAK